jgi:hypothetical protein
VENGARVRFDDASARHVVSSRADHLANAIDSHSSKNNLPQVIYKISVLRPGQLAEKPYLAGVTPFGRGLATCLFGHI